MSSLFDENNHPFDQPPAAPHGGALADTHMRSASPPPGSGSPSRARAGPSQQQHHQQQQQQHRAPPGNLSSFPFTADPFTTEARSPPGSFVSSPSPEDSSGGQTSPSPPFSSPFATPLRQPAALRLPRRLAATLSTPPTAGVGQSPWAALAATAGAPTPSLEFPPGARGSPQLGHPFERLNIGTSWSAGNLKPNNDDRSSMPVTPFGSSPARAGAEGGAGSVPAGPIAGRSLTLSPTSSILAQRRASMPAGPLGSLPLLSSRIQPIDPLALRPLLASDKSLMLDLRLPSSYEESHLPQAHSVSVPSTLLRRPAFGVGKLVSMLTSKQSQDAVSAWRDTKDIILVDQDSTVVTDGSVLQGVASKFEREGYNGNLWFVNGGHAAIITSKSCEVVTGSPRVPDSATVPTTGSSSSTISTIPPTPNQLPAVGGGLGRLSRFAFQQGSTKSAPRTGVPMTAALSRQPEGFPFRSGSASSAPDSSRRSRSIETSRTRLQPANPFFDNIRQNLELSHGGITERIPLQLPEELADRADELPPFLRELVKMSDEGSAETLARQFYRVERSEQTRLQAVMDTMSKGSFHRATDGSSPELPQGAADVERLMHAEPDSTYYPFSITAGLEQGTKNRYKNIWPFDYTRVRLAGPSDKSDYINASFVQPRGTSRRYIATQGPLEATFSDFWSLVWEQNVHVIVMLTRQFESGTDKCGRYWVAQEYGDLRLQLVSQTGGDDQVEAPTSGFDFSTGAPAAKEEGTVEDNVKRVFKLWHIAHADKARTITQFQCVTWPDFDVPQTPSVLLDLMRDVDAAVEDSTECDDDHCSAPPVLVHCSAGIGRTGSYILIDAITDGLRREHKLQKEHTSSLLDASALRIASSPPRPPSSPGGAGSPTGSMDLDSPVKRGASLPNLASASADSSRQGADVLAKDALIHGEAKIDEPPSPIHSPLSDPSAPTPMMDLDSDSPVENEEDEAVPDAGSSSAVSGEPEILDPNTNVVVNEPEPLSPTKDRSIISREPSMPSLSEHAEDEATPIADEESSSLEVPMAPTLSHRPHHKASSLNSMENPIADVLLGMRTQRMSLVQSLRQYVFVHRAIIAHYLRMVDAEKNAVANQESSGDTVATDITAVSMDSSAPASGSASFLTHSSTAVSTVGTDDDGHFKRKTSSADLQDERGMTRHRSRSVEGSAEAEDGASLLKRLSFKKRRQGTPSQMERAASDEGRAAKGARDK